MPKSAPEDGEIIEHDQAPEVIEVSSGSDGSPHHTPVINLDAPFPVLEPPVQPLNPHFPQSSAQNFTPSPPPYSASYPPFSHNPWQVSPTFTNSTLQPSPNFDPSHFGHRAIASNSQQWGGRQKGGFRSALGGSQAFGSRGDIRVEPFRDGGEYIPPPFKTNEGYSPPMPYNPHGVRTTPPDINPPHQGLYEATHPHVNFGRGALGTKNGYGPVEGSRMGAGVDGRFGMQFGDVRSSGEMTTEYMSPTGRSGISQGFATRGARQQSLYEKFPPSNVASGGASQALNSSQEGRWSRRRLPLSVADEVHPLSSVFMSHGIVTSPVPVPDDASPLSMRCSTDGDGRRLPYTMEPEYQPAMPSVLNRTDQNVKPLIDRASSVIGSHDEGGSLDTARFSHPRGGLSTFTPFMPRIQGENPGGTENVNVHMDAHNSGSFVEGWTQNMSCYRPNTIDTQYKSTRRTPSVLSEPVPKKSALTLGTGNGGNGTVDTAENEEGEGKYFNLLPMHESEPEVRPLLLEDGKMASSDRPVQTEEATKQPIEQPTMQRKQSKPRLLELRKKVLLSMMQKSKTMEQGELSGHDRPSARIVEPTSEVTYVADHNADMEPSTLPLHSIPAGLQYTQLIVEVSDIESEDGSESSSTDDSSGDAEDFDKGTAIKDRDLTSKLSRERIIENMRIRMVQIGRCPSSLEIRKNCRSSPSAILTSTTAATQSPAQLSMRQDTVIQNGVDTKNGDDDIQMRPEPLVSPIDGLLRSSSSKSSKDSAANLERPSAMNLEQGVISSTNTSSRPPTNTLKGLEAAETKEFVKNRSEHILSLKKQIAALEARNVRKRKFVMMDAMDITNANCAASPLQTGDSPVARTTDTTPQHVLSQKSKQQCNSTFSTMEEELDTMEPASKRRYYSAEVSRKKNEKRVGSSEKGPTTSSSKILQSQQEQNQKTAEGSEEVGIWNQRQFAQAKDVVLPDRTDAGLVDDLKSELETQKKQIANIQDYSKLVLASDVSLAQAAAKLSFKRNRVANLEQELKRAKFEVIDAEQDYNKIANAAKRMRATLDGLGFSDMFPPPDISTANNDRKSANLANGTVTANGGSNGELPQSDTDSCEKTDSEPNISETGGEDPILRQSPYSPSTGNTFLSCLSGLQSFVVRIPHHRKAADRKFMSPLSLTWTHNLNPMKTMCPRELHRTYSCVDKKCEHEHLRNFQARTGHALDVVDRVQAFVDSTIATEKQVVRAKIELYSGKNVDDTVSTLISSLCPIPSKAPFSRSSD